MRRISILLIVSLLLSLGGGCGKAEPGAGDHTKEPGVREPATLVLTADLSALVASTGTRASKADVNLIDHISLFLIDYNDNRLVAYRNIFDPNNPAYPQIANDADGSNGFVNDAGQVDTTLSQSRVVRVTFDYNAPKHGDVEKLARGNYVLLAVANYSESDTFGNTGVAARVQSLVANFDPNSGIENFNPGRAEFYNLQLRIPEIEGAPFPYLRPSDVLIPQSCSENINLVAGVNRTSVKLEYTSARIRIGVRNYSDVDLSISDLAFSDNFTQSTCYLFSRLDSDGNYALATDYHGKGAPLATHENAVTPFVPDQIITKDMGVTTIFDGLIYESRDLDNNYVYTLEVGTDDYYTFSLSNDGKRIYRLSDVDAQGPYFIIKRRGLQSGELDSYLYVENDRLYVTEQRPSGTYSPQEVLDACKEAKYYNYIWKLEKSGSGYYVRNVETEDYIQKITVAAPDSPGEQYRLQMIGWEDYATQAELFTLTQNSTGSGYYLFRSGTIGAYLNIRPGTSGSEVVVGYNGNGEWSQFVLYPVQYGKSVREDIVLRTIDSETGVASDVHEIKRNDFIRVQVGVTYNPYRGNFEFVVEDWKTGGGDITFN